MYTECIALLLLLEEAGGRREEAGGRGKEARGTSSPEARGRREETGTNTL